MLCVSRRAWVPAVLLAVLAVGYGVTASRGAVSLDVWSANLASWSIGTTGTPLTDLDRFPALADNDLRATWVVQRADGRDVVGRAPGTVAAAVPAYALAHLFGASGMSIVPGGLTAALLTAIAIVDRQLRGSPYSARRALALCFFLGALSQLTMVFGVCAILGWYGFAIWRREGFRTAVAASWSLFAVPLLALVAALALVFVPAVLSSTGFQFGHYDPFEIMQYLHGVVEMIGYTVAWPIDSGWLIAAALVLLVLARPAGAGSLAFYRLAIFAFPFLLAVLHSGNVAHPRYYLVAGIALLLLMGEMAALALRHGGWRRAVAAVGLIAFTLPALALDVDLIRNQRGDAGAAVRAMHVTEVATVKSDTPQLPPPGAKPGILGTLPARVASASANVPLPASAPSETASVKHSGWMIQVGAFDDE